jgi:hypothetical protein
MPSRARLEWKGAELLARVTEAARSAVNETVDETRDDALATHPWKDDPRERRLSAGGPLVDPKLELHIKSEHADPAAPNPKARVGYTRRSGFYGLFHELGTVHEHAFPTLRPAADRVFPTVFEKLRRRLG